MDYLTLAFTDESEAQQYSRPSLPPSSSMAPDFSSFDKESADQRVTCSNWTYAARNVDVYAQMLNSNLFIPVTAFKLAANQHSRFEMTTGLWIWEYEIKLQSKGTFHIKLTADVHGPSDVVWRAYFSKNKKFENFIWFEGKSAINGESGKWILYGNPNNPSPWLSSIWVREDHNNFSTTLIIEKEGVYQNSLITYEINEDQPLNRRIIISDTNTLSLIHVDWSSISGHGRVKSEAFFGDDLYHYWDKGFNDMIYK